MPHNTLLHVHTTLPGIDLHMKFNNYVEVRGIIVLTILFRCLIYLIRLRLNVSYTLMRDTISKSILITHNNVHILDSLNYTLITIKINKQQLLCKLSIKLILIIQNNIIILTEHIHLHKVLD